MSPHARALAHLVCIVAAITPGPFGCGASVTGCPPGSDAGSNCATRDATSDNIVLPMRDGSSRPDGEGVLDAGPLPDDVVEHDTGPRADTGTGDDAGILVDTESAPDSAPSSDVVSAPDASSGSDVANDVGSDGYGCRVDLDCPPPERCNVATGVCMVMACPSGFGDCDGDAANGCETDLTSDPSNCGACAAACAGVCVSGMCVACSAGSTCSTGHECETGSAQCPSSGPMCVRSGYASAGTPCTDGVCNGSGICVRCMSGAPCTPGGSACRLGSVDCTTGAAVCVFTGNAPAGTSCGAGQVCNGFGMCGDCGGIGAACTPGGNTCEYGAITCSSGAPSCAVTGYVPAGTPCSGGSCDGAGHCV